MRCRILAFCAKIICGDSLFRLTGFAATFRRTRTAERSRTVRLQRKLRSIRQQAEAGLPTGLREANERLVADLKARGIEAQAIRAGMAAPDFALPDTLGRTVSLAEALARGPVVLSFYRGRWCPYCCAELRALQFVLPQLKALGASLIAVSPELPDNSLSPLEKMVLDYSIVSDLGLAVARAYGLVFRLPEDMRGALLDAGLNLAKRNGDEGWELPIPATYVLAPSGLVRLAFVDADFTQRFEPQEIVTLLSEPSGPSPRPDSS